MISFIKMDIKLWWNGTSIGDISDFLVRKNDKEYDYTLTNDFVVMKLLMADGKEISIIVEDYDTIKLLGDELKLYFNMVSIGYHSATIGDKKYLISEYENNILFTSKYESVKKFKKINNNKVFIEEVKKCFCLQWLLHLRNMSGDRIMVRNLKVSNPETCTEPVYPTLYNENYVCSGKNIPLNQKFINQLYENMYEFYLIIYKMFEGKSRFTISNDIRDIIYKIDPSLISWKNDILNQVEIVLSVLCLN